jgi:hypothetical protein
MQVSAMSSAVVGMQRANSLMNEAAAVIARDTAVSPAAPVAVPAGPEDGMISAIPNLLVARTLLAANAAVARTASEAYEATLAWVDRAS